jgi:hypothetical protein
MKIMAKYGWVILGLMLVLFCVPDAMAQCSICTKTASELGPESAKGLNAGILYLMAVPFALGGVIGYRWWKSNSLTEDENA